MVSQEVEKTVEKIYQKVNGIEQALRGYNGQPGLIKDHEKLKTDYFKFKRLVLIIFSFAIGSGGLGISIWTIFGG